MNKLSALIVGARSASICFIISAYASLLPDLFNPASAAGASVSEDDATANASALAAKARVSSDDDDDDDEACGTTAVRATARDVRVNVACGFEDAHARVV